MGGAEGLCPLFPLCGTGILWVSVLLACTSLSPFHHRGQSHLSVVATVTAILLLAARSLAIISFQHRVLVGALAGGAGPALWQPLLDTECCEQPLCPGRTDGGAGDFTSAPLPTLAGAPMLLPLPAHSRGSASLPAPNRWITVILRTVFTAKLCSQNPWKAAGSLEGGDASEALLSPSLCATGRGALFVHISLVFQCVTF